MTRIGSLFSGSGQLDEGVRAVLGGTVAWHAEIEPAAVRVLDHRYPGVPNLGDVSSVDWTTVEPVDVLTGGFPCQDVSHAGARRGLREGTRSGLWARMCDAIDALRPPLVIAENVRGLLSAEADSALEPCAGCVGDGDDGAVLRALGRVLGDLAGVGYDARWCGLRAADVGAPHGRFRVFIVATDAGRTDVQRRADAVGGVTAGRATTSPHERLAAPPTANADNVGHEWRGYARRRWHGLADGGQPAADADGAGLQGMRAGGRGTARPESGETAWGVYEPAIRRWEHLTRPAPAPTETGPKGGQRLSPRFTEWMQGWPDGWVTDVPGVSRNEALKLCGNGVVPQQSAEALRRMLAAHATEAVA